jgi:acetyl-CoA acetyltransferase
VAPALRPAAIVGAALSDTGTVEDRSVFALHQQAAARALDDAGLAKDDVDGFASVGTGVLPPVEVAEHLGLRPTWVDSTGVGGSTWLVLLEHAVAAVQTGQARVVLIVYASTARSDLRHGRRSANLALSSSGPAQFEVPYGHTLIAKYAMTARRHMHEHGTTLEQLAEVAVSTRFNAGLNPQAAHRDPITVDDVLSGPMIADPLTKLQCCIRSDGGGAVVVTTAERALDLERPPVWVLGAASASSHTTMSEWADFTVSPAARSGPLAFARAGLAPSDVDVCTFYDAFTIMLPMTYEALGFCAKGEGGPFAADGRMRVGGALPTNPDGGGLSACHPGMRGIFLLVEAVRQLRGEAGARQVAGAEIACANGTGGWFSSAATVLLGAPHTA